MMPTTTVELLIRHDYEFVCVYISVRDWISACLTTMDEESEVELGILISFRDCRRTAFLSKISLPYQNAVG